MQKLLLKISPLLIFLLIFSCAKDHDLHPQNAETELIQAREDGEGKACEIPCRKPDFINVSEITGCSAVLSWGFEAKTCGTFVIQLQNLSTGDWTYFDPAVSPFNLTNLDPCTRYTVGVSHITDYCASIPLQISFETDCRKCKECNIKCKDPDYAFVNAITENSATFNFGFFDETCGYFVAQLKNNATGTYTYFDPASSPLVLTGLDPCTSYTIGVSHVTSLCARIPTKVTFTTDCPEYCDVEGLDPTCLHNQYITFTFDQHPGIWTHGSHTLGYADFTGSAITVTPGAVLSNTAAGNCFCGNYAGDVYMKLWIDANQNYTFESSELMYNYMITLSGGGSSAEFCLDMPMPGFTVPNVVACGLRGRYIISSDASAGPCGNFAIGQAVDFSINTMDPCSLQ